MEGPLWFFPDVVATFQHPEQRELCLSLLRRLEGEPSLLGTSAPLLAVARKSLDT